ncbi:MAG: 50S ribosomal protein L24 [Candidatus Paceibacterota bacterium]
MRKIQKGDQVLITTGQDEGKAGKVVRVIPQEEKVVVEGLNLQKKNIRPQKKEESGQVVEFPAPMDISNVKLICSSCDQPTRVGFSEEGDEKFRVCKKCGDRI